MKFLMIISITLLATNIVFANEEINIIITPKTQQACIDTEWLPNLENYTTDTLVKQTSNCKRTKYAYGNCVINNWSPEPNTIPEGQTFTQTSNCNTTRQSIGTLCIDTTWSPDPNTVWEGETFIQTSNCGRTRQANGTKVNIITKILISKVKAINLNTGEEIITSAINLSPNTKTFNEYLSYTVPDNPRHCWSQNTLTPAFAYYTCLKTGNTQYPINDITFTSNTFENMHGGIWCDHSKLLTISCP